MSAEQLSDFLWNMGHVAVEIIALIGGAVLGACAVLYTKKTVIQKSWVKAYCWANDVLNARIKDIDNYVVVCKQALKDDKATDCVKRMIHWMAIERRNLGEGLLKLGDPP